jgi:pantoate--beta-alanine ligase
MKVTRSLRDFLRVRRALATNISVGFVPTMGALHEGHLSLVNLAKSQCEYVVSSIFVNPTQFGPNEDLSKYPRQEEKDIEGLQLTGNVDCVFLPSVKDVYPSGFSTFVNVDGIEEQAESASRPGHFRGVATVVSKLFNMVQPTHAYFGAKDAMQCIVIKKMVRDLNIPVEVVIGDTLREHDGLAMSSRNVYLSEEERKVAPVVYRSLSAAKLVWEHEKRNGSHEVDANALKQAVQRVLDTEPRITTQYISVGSKQNGAELNKVDTKEGAILSLAVKLGATRLIDNFDLR